MPYRTTRQPIRPLPTSYGARSIRGAEQTGRIEPDLMTGTDGQTFSSIPNLVTPGIRASASLVYTVIGNLPSLVYGVANGHRALRFNGGGLSISPSYSTALCSSVGGVVALAFIPRGTNANGRLITTTGYTLKAEPQIRMVQISGNAQIWATGINLVTDQLNVLIYETAIYSGYMQRGAMLVNGSKWLISGNTYTIFPDTWNTLWTLFGTSGGTNYIPLDLLEMGVWVSAPDGAGGVNYDANPFMDNLYAHYLKKFS